EFDPLRRCSVDPLPQQPIDADQKRGERLSRASRGGNQRMAAGGDCRPALALRLGRLTETAGKPLANQGMGEVEGHTALRRQQALGLDSSYEVLNQGSVAIGFAIGENLPGYAEGERR